MISARRAVFQDSPPFRLVRAARPRPTRMEVEAADVCADSVRADETLTLSPAVTTKLKALAADAQMQRLWQTISPGKKAAASGSAGPLQTPIDAAMRAAVAKALAVAAAAQRNRPRLQSFLPHRKPSIETTNE